jgi:periplasmic nitrate reductase NapD
MSGIHISSLVVRAIPDRRDEIAARIAALGPAEVALADEYGRLVVTLETDSEDEIVAAMSAMQHLDGVISTALVYHHSEDGARPGAAADERDERAEP